MPAKYDPKKNVLTREQALKQALQVRPVNGIVTSAHGFRTSPYSGFHTGTDYRAAIGTAVKASGPGRVVGVERNSPTFGMTVTIDHGYGITTSYSHLSEISVSKGDYIAGGSEIAKSGNSGTSTGAHLDFVVRTDGEPNPYRASRVPEETIDAELYLPARE